MKRLDPLFSFTFLSKLATIAVCCLLHPSITFSSIQVSSCPVYSTLLGAGGVAATKSSLLVQHVRDFQSGADHKSPWRSACFSSDSAHVIGASANKAEHALYIWSRQTGHLERVLEGTEAPIEEDLVQVFLLLTVNVRSPPHMPCLRLPSPP